MMGNKDTDRIILENLDDKSLIYACNTSQHFRNKVCDETFFKKRIYERYPEFVNRKLEEETWKDFFLKIVKKEIVLGNQYEIIEENKKEKFFEKSGNFEYVAKRNGNELTVYMLLDGVRLGDMKMVYRKELESYDELFLLQQTKIGDELWGNKIKDNMISLNLKSPHILISWIGIRIGKEGKGYGKILLRKGLQFAKKMFPYTKFAYLYRAPQDSLKLLHFYNSLEFTDTGFKGVMYLNLED